MLWVRLAQLSRAAIPLPVLRGTCRNHPLEKHFTEYTSADQIMAGLWEPTVLSFTGMAWPGQDRTAEFRRLYMGYSLSTTAKVGRWEIPVSRFIPVMVDSTGHRLTQVSRGLFVRRISWIAIMAGSWAKAAPYSTGRTVILQSKAARSCRG